MLSPKPNAALFEALAEFEKSLETPVVPGELTSWVDQARDALSRVHRELDEHAAANHTEIFDDIVRQDPSLYDRVDQMREEDRQLIVRLQEFEQRLAGLSQAAFEAEPDEGQLSDRIDAAVHHGLKFVIDARKLEHALTTWYLEAFERDRGLGD